MPNVPFTVPTISLDTDHLDQHLTVNPDVVARLVRSAELDPSDTALDIGAGTGLITRAIARRGCATIAIELDHRFSPYLTPLHGTARISVCWTDFRAIAPKEVTTIVANPPFGATEHLVSWFARLPRLRRVSLIVGARFARAAVAIPGSADYTRLSLHLQAAFAARVHGTVHRADFYPVTRRDATIVTLVPVQPGPLMRTFDEAVGRNAGMRLEELVRDLHQRGLISGDSCEPLSGFRHKRLQELTNDEISRTALTLSSAGE